VGSGPAGLFAATELIAHSDASVLLIEQVKRLHDTRNVSNGWFGGSAKSDVRLFIDPGFGGEIKDLAIIEYFLATMQSYSEYFLKINSGKLTNRLVENIIKHDVTVEDPTTIVVPSDKLIAIELACRDALRTAAKVKTNCHVKHIVKKKGYFEIITSSGEFRAKKCILAMGRGGAHWLRNLSKDFDGLEYEDNKYDLGVRLEFPHPVIKEYTEKSSGFRLKWGPYRTSAVSSYGTVEMENVFDVKTSNSRTITGKHTYYSSMGLLKTFKQEGALEKALNLVQIANILADGQLLKEPVSKLLTGTSVLSPLPEYNSLIDGIQKILEIFPKMERKCFLYAPESRLNTIRFQLSKHMETGVKGLYIAGDMSGQTKSFVQSACSGLLAAQHIVGLLG
jgi:uncharacterized FAD-dependent dehydrogenase